MIDDIGRFTRIKAAIDAIIASTGRGVIASEGLADAANRFTREITAMLPDNLRSEFQALFPEDATPNHGWAGGDLIAAAAASEGARVRLVGISGWLQGVVDSAGR
jgi:hypothetical protein